MKWVQLYISLNILWHCPSLGLEWKLTFAGPVATAEFSKFADIIDCSILTASYFGIWDSSDEIPSPPLALLLVLLPAAAKSLQSCPTLCDPMVSSPPDSSVPGILQARTLEWVAIPAPMHESENESEVAQACLTLSDTMDGSLLLHPWNFPGKSTGVSCHCLLLVMLPKTHLTSHSRMSGSRWVTTPLWLSGSLRLFL